MLEVNVTKRLTILFVLAVLLCLLKQAYAADRLSGNAGQNDWRRTHIRRALAAGLPDAELDMLSRAGINVLQVDLWGYGTEGMQDTAFGDQLDKFVVHAHKVGIKVTLYVNTRATKRLDTHPEWSVVGPDGKPKNGALAVCQNSPGGQILIDEMVRCAKRHAIDGFWLDCWTYDAQTCWCPYCRKMFTEETGLEMPTAPDLSDPRFCKYVEWRDRAGIRFFERMRAALNSVRTDLGIWVNFASGIGPAPLTVSDSVFRAVEGPAFEMWMPRQMDFALNNPFAVSRLYGLSGGGDPEVWVLPTANGYNDWTTVPDIELLSRVMTCVTYGTTVQLPSWPGHDQQLATVFQSIKAREKYLIGAKPLKYAALLTSYRSAEFYGRTESVSKYWEELQGAWRALSEEHLPVQFITEQDIADGKLSDYKVVVIPNGACLSDAVMSGLRTFLRSGGGLVATHETSLYDDYGTIRTDFALSDILGAHYAGSETTAEFQGDRVWFTDHTITNDPKISYSKMDGKTVWGGLPGTVDWLGRSLNVNTDAASMIPSKRSIAGGREAKWPFLILNQYGKGRVCYFPEEVGSSYYHTSYAYLRRLIRNGTVWAAGQEPSVFVKGPMCLASTYWEQNNGNRIVVQLLNDLGSTGMRARDAVAGYTLTRETKYMPIREEIIPIHDVKVYCKLPGVTKAFLEPDRKPLRIVKHGDGVETTVPVVELHNIVVFEK